MREIDVVGVDALHRRLGFDHPLDYPHDGTALSEWNMEVNDSPILRYLYRHFRPRRHLEFGTWQGTGVTYCLEECEATVWTINLLDGELKEDEGWAYATNSFVSEGRDFLRRKFLEWTNKMTVADDNVYYQTDARGFIGRYYLEAGLGHRVCQIYCDSGNWDTTNYPEGFFDSVLIDGGHQKDVVANDTLKAIPLLRPGGLIIWHDFCVDRDVLENYPHARSVASGILESLPAIRDDLQDLFWIDPSWILIGRTQS